MTGFTSANIPDRTAVKTWGDYVEQYHGKATLVSPSVDSNEAWGKPWLDSFLSQASGKGYHIDLIGLHWYVSWSTCSRWVCD